jgi:hypothetical protein
MYSRLVATGYGRGLALERRAAESGQVITIVDSETAQQNVARMAEKAGCQVQAEKRADGIYLNITQGDSPMPEASVACANTPTSGPLVLTIPSEFMGRGDEELGHVLIRAFLILTLSKKSYSFTGRT